MKTQKASLPQAAQLNQIVQSGHRLLNPLRPVRNLLPVIVWRFGELRKTNEDEAVVKWDDDGRQRLGQPWLKKI